MRHPDVSAGRRPSGRLLLPLLFAVVLFLTGCAEARTAATQNWSAAQPDDGRIFIGTREGQLHQLDPTTGRSLIAPYTAEPTQRGGFPAFYGTPTIANGLIYAGGYHGLVYAMRAASLDQVRQFEIDGNPLTKGIAGSVVPAGDFVVTGAAEDSGAGRVYVLHAETLVEECRYPARGTQPMGQVWSTPLVVNGVIYVGTLDHQLHAIRVEDCTPAWPSPADLHGAVAATPLVVNDKIYVGTFDRKFYEVDKETGRSEVLFEADSWFWATPAFDGQRLYVPNLDGRLYAYDLQRRTVAWDYEPPGNNLRPMLATPAIHAGLVIVGDDRGVLTWIRAADGVRERDLAVRGGAVRAALTISNNTLFVHTIDGVLTSINLQTARCQWEGSLERDNWVARSC